MRIGRDVAISLCLHHGFSLRLRDDECIKHNYTSAIWKYQKRIHFNLYDLWCRTKNAADEFNRIRESIEVGHHTTSDAAQGGDAA